jgi:hypothetical protein
VADSQSGPEPGVESGAAARLFVLFQSLSPQDRLAFLILIQPDELAAELEAAFIAARNELDQATTDHARLRKANTMLSRSTLNFCLKWWRMRRKTSDRIREENKKAQQMRANGAPWKAIDKHLGCKPGTVRQRLYQERKKRR